MCGGGSLLRGVNKFLTRAIGIPGYMVDNPLTCTVEDAVNALEMKDLVKRSLASG